MLSCAHGMSTKAMWQTMNVGCCMFQLMSGHHMITIKCRQSVGMIMICVALLKFWCVCQHLHLCGAYLTVEGTPLSWGYYKLELDKFDKSHGCICFPLKCMYT